MSEELSKAELWREWQAAMAENEQLRAVLRQVQWAGGGEYEKEFCPLCDQHETKGHSPDCPVGLALEGGEG